MITKPISAGLMRYLPVEATLYQLCGREFVWRGWRIRRSIATPYGESQSILTNGVLLHELGPR
jgi:hypothetical protein